jgi:aminoglycoside phosphotransferase (APT) family kinase protein
MDIPAELRNDPPRSTLEWVAGHFGPGAKVTGIRRMQNAWAAAVHALDVDDTRGRRHDLILRRWARTDLVTDVGVVENEAATLTFLETCAPGLVAPRLVVADPDATAADAPALVMTRLPGHDDLSPADLGAYLDGLATTLRAVHAAPIPGAALGDYFPWGLDDLTDPPPWTRRPEVWRRAFEIAQRPVPPFTPVLCHRDFHPGNVLWQDGRVTGVVDWTSTCRGPVACDVAHCRNNLALLFGLEVADDFARRYGRVDDLAWFDIVDVVGWGELETWRWQGAGRPDITDDIAIRAADDFLAAAVARFTDAD